VTDETVSARPAETPAAGEEAPRRRFVLTERVVWWTSFLVFASFGVLWSFSTALMGSPDEPAHTVKAVAVARGDLATSVEWERTPFGIVLPLTYVETPAEYTKLNRLSECWRNDLAQPITCAPSSLELDGTDTATTTAGAYPPAFYGLVGWPSWFLSLREAVYAMRIVGALLCAALFASGLVSARTASAGPLVFAGAALALTPTTLFLVGSVNPNGLEIAAAFCVWTSMLALLRHRAVVPSRLLARLTVSGVLLVSARTLSPAFLVAIVVVVLFAGADRTVLARWWRQRRVRACVGIVSLAAVASIVYVLVNRSYDAVIAFEPLDMSKAELLHASWDRTGRRFTQAFGVLSWSGPAQIQLDRWLLDAWLLATAALTAVGLVLGRWRERIAIFAAAAGFVALPIVSDLLTAQEKNFLWLGRYGLPLGIGAPILAGWAADRSGRVPRAVGQVAATVVCAGVALVHVSAHERVMTRNLVGLPNGLFSGVLEARWPGPLTPELLVTAFFATAVVFAAWLLVLGTYGRDRGAASTTL
jgi:hypothetical protein